MRLSPLDGNVGWQMNHTSLIIGLPRRSEVIGKLLRLRPLPDTRATFDAGFRDVLGPARSGMAECELVTRSPDVSVIQGTAYTNRLGFRAFAGWQISST
ncbi:hypothetical protein DSL92_04160 [Billgrantia gudaonensis]|uniref:Uncharacterized protein n=1 Tax=Billgrantia gudaonensis TaxID=376427 RepID=A0A432JKD9_9GAMM|nr:hypothetical protein DSL92_04160 [Halomonas gudaonensis]